MIVEPFAHSRRVIEKGMSRLAKLPVRNFHLLRESENVGITLPPGIQHDPGVEIGE